MKFKIFRENYKKNEGENDHKANKTIKQTFSHRFNGEQMVCVCVCGVAPVCHVYNKFFGI